MSKHTVASLIITLVLLFPLSLRAQERRSWSEAQRPIVDLIQRTAQANNAGDVEEWVGLFAEGAVYMPPGAPAVTTRRGLVEIAEAGFRHDSEIEIEPMEIVVTGPWAYARNEVSGTVTIDPTGEEVTVDVKQIVIYRRTESGEWRIARLISNSNS